MNTQPFTPEIASPATIAHNYVTGGQAVTNHQLAQVAEAYLTLRKAIATYADEHKQWADNADPSEYDADRIDDSYRLADALHHMLGTPHDE